MENLEIISLNNNELMKVLENYKEKIEKNKRYQKNYYLKNKDKINRVNNEAYKNKYSKDPEFLSRRSEYFKKRYLIKKEKAKNYLVN